MTKQSESASERRRLIKNLDDTWQAIVTSPGYCLVCGYSGSLVGHHAIHTVAHGFHTRWLLDNGACVCGGIGGCHGKIHDACHHIGDRLRELMIERIGIERYEAVLFMRDGDDWTNDRLREILAELRKIALDKGVEIR